MVEDALSPEMPDGQGGEPEAAEVEPAPPVDLTPPVEPVLSPVRFNAVKHGIISVSPVIPWFEREEDWLAHRDSVFEGLAPVGGLEMALADQVASGMWRQLRVVRYEREAVAAHQMAAHNDLELDALINKREVPREVTPEVKQKLDRSAMLRLLPGDHALDRIIRYQGMLRREVDQALRHLQSLQKERRKSAEMDLVRDVFTFFGPRHRLDPEDRSENGN